MLLHFFKRLPLLLCAGTILVFTSCNEETSATDSVNDASKNPSTMNSIESDDTDKSDAKTIEVEESAPQKTPTVEGNAEVRLNPPHGEPGHNCDVKVGDPLN